MSGAEEVLVAHHDVDRRVVGQCVAQLQARLRVPGLRPADVRRVLDYVSDSLGELVLRCSDDKLATSLGESRAVAGAYLCATIDLDGADGIVGELLQQGHAQVLEHLAAVQRVLDGTVDQ